MTRIAVYDCVTGDALTEKYGRTGVLIVDWLRPHLSGVDWSTVHVAGNAALPDPGQVEAVLISGSEKGVYDDVPWMAPLRANLLAMRETGVPIYGICFGHQIMADTFGGRAEKADQGFVTGTRAFRVGEQERPAFLAHQDQVTQVPPGARVTATAAHCPIAGLAYDFPAASVQFHPEYDAGFTGDLIDMFGSELMSEAQIRAARESLIADVNADLWVREVAAFFRQALDLA